MREKDYAVRQNIFVHECRELHESLLGPPHADEGKRPLAQKDLSTKATKITKVYAVGQKTLVHKCRELHE
jgi:hypothetical protein